MNRRVRKAISRLTAMAGRAGHDLRGWKQEWPHQNVWQTGCKKCSSYIFLFTDEDGTPKKHYKGLYECQSNFIFKKDYEYTEMKDCWGTDREAKYAKKEEIRFKRFIPIAKEFLHSENPSAHRLARMLVAGTDLLNYDDIEADEIEAGIMKKTTQRSPEWRGGANCSFRRKKAA
ncbi:MAG: hypothetical protein KAR40_07960 [Candidatus Sabulitectum sp.]|nr:hypothetical protein [Candidatus Sabulitectum sp.]